MMNSTVNTMVNGAANNEVKGGITMSKSAKAIVSATEISSREEFMNYEKYFMKMERAYVPMLVVGEKSYFQMNPQALGETLENAEQGTIEILCRNNYIVIENDDKIQCVQGYLKVKYNNPVLRKEMHNKHNEVWVNFKEGKAWVVKYNAGNVLIGVRDLMEGKYDSRITPDELAALLTGATLWKGLNYSPSDIRTGKALWIKSEGGVEIRDAVLDELTDGAYSVAKGEEFKQAKLTAAFGRSAQKNPSSVNLGYIGNGEYGILWIQEEIVSELSTRNGLFTEKQSTWDGGSWLNAHLYAMICTKRLRSVLGDDSITISPNALVGGQPQIRFSLAKVSCEVDSKEIFERRSQNFMAKYKYEIVGNPDNIVAIVDNNGLKNFCGIFPDIRNSQLRLLALDKATPANTSKTQMLSKIAHFPGVKDLIVERTIAEVELEMNRLYPDKDTKPGIVTKEEALGGGYAVDTLTKLCPALNYDPAIAFMKARNSVQKITNMIDKTKFTIGGCFTRIWLDDTETLLSDEQVESMGDKSKRGIIDDGYAYNAGFVRHYKAELEKYKAAHKEEIDARIDTIKSDDSIADKKAAIKDLMKQIEIEANISRLGWMVKYPAPGKKEVYCFTFLLPEDIKSIAKSLDFDKDTTRMIIDNILNSRDSRLILPAEDILKYQEAGLDMDFDGAVCYWDAEFAEFFHRIERTIVRIHRPEEVVKEQVAENKYATRFSRINNIPQRVQDKHIICADNGMSIGYDRQMDNENMSVGSCTNTGYTFNACKTLEQKARVINISLKTKGANKKYVSPLDVTTIHLPSGDAILYNVSLLDAKKVEANIKDSDLSNKENLDAIQNDIDILFRMFQELLIDSSKKGDKVPVNFKIKEFKPDSLVKLTNNFEEFSKYLYDLKSNNTTKEEESDNCFFRIVGDTRGVETIYDDMAEIQDAMVEVAEPAYDVNLKAIAAEARLVDDEVSELEDKLLNFEDVIADIDTTVKSLYKMCVSEYMNNLAEINKLADQVDKNELKDMQDEVKEVHKLNISVLDNLLNMILKDVVATEGLSVAGSILKATSCLASIKEDGMVYTEIDPRGTNSMPYSVGYVYTLARVLDMTGTTITGYSLVKGTAKHVKAGEVIEFNNGRAIASNGKMVLLNGSIASGTFTIVDNEGTLYATQEFSINDISAPEINENEVTLRVRRSFDVKRAMNGDVILYDSDEATETNYKKQRDVLALGKFEDMMEAVKDAKEVTLLPVFYYNYEVDGSPYAMVVDNAIVATFEDEEGEFFVPVGTYAVESPTLESIYNGVHGTVGHMMLGYDGNSLMMVINKEGQDPIKESFFDKKGNTTKHKETVIDDEEIIDEDAKHTESKNTKEVKAEKTFVKPSFKDEEEEIIEEEVTEEEYYDEEEIIEEE
jgi:hypothetical protein